MSIGYTTVLWAPIFASGMLGFLCLFSKQIRFGAWAIPAMLVALEVTSLVEISENDQFHEVIVMQIKILIQMTLVFLILHGLIEVFSRSAKKKPKPVLKALT